MPTPNERKHENRIFANREQELYEVTLPPKQRLMRGNYQQTIYTDEALKPKEAHDRLTLALMRLRQIQDTKRYDKLAGLAFAAVGLYISQRGDNIPNSNSRFRLEQTSRKTRVLVRS